MGLNKRPSISVVTVLGDGSSVLHVTKNQTFFIEYQEFTRRRSFPPVNFKVDYSGEVMLVSDVHVAGKKNPAFELEGRITGVSNLTLTEGRVFLGTFSLPRAGSHYRNYNPGQKCRGKLLINSREFADFPFTPCCFLRQETLFHISSLHPGV